jgi:hypothetical protein
MSYAKGFTPQLSRIMVNTVSAWHQEYLSFYVSRHVCTSISTTGGLFGVDAIAMHHASQWAAEACTWRAEIRFSKYAFLNCSSVRLSSRFPRVQTNNGIEEIPNGRQSE